MQCGIQSREQRQFGGPAEGGGSTAPPDGAGNDVKVRVLH